MREKLIVIGAGGHARACLDLVESLESYEVIGVLDILGKKTSLFMGYPILEEPSLLNLIREGCSNVLIAIGQIKECQRRLSWQKKLEACGAKFPPLISPKAHVSSHAKIAEGTVVMPFAMVGPGAEVSRHCILNSRSLVEHDVTIGSFTHVATGAIINGECRIGQRVFLGSGSVISSHLSVADEAIVGAGAVVVKSIEEAGTYFGNPAKKMVRI